MFQNTRRELIIIKTELVVDFISKLLLFNRCVGHDNLRWRDVLLEHNLTVHIDLSLNTVFKGFNDIFTGSLKLELLLHKSVLNFTQSFVKFSEFILILRVFLSGRCIIL